jgi:hypothetical protein
MTWSYSAAQLNKPLYRVRFMIGDRYCAEQQFQDEEIIDAITRRGSIYGACADLCRSLSVAYSRSVDFAIVGGGRANYSQLSKQYLRQAILFDAKAASSGAAMPYFAGISEADKQNQVLDIDRVPPLFQRGMTDNVQTIAPTGIESEQVGSD